ncbi:hypothetical protein [Micromonospora siamensis]|uniref:Uncharacterized protein n=1 Tax=Micromonospora siamensis TaxID=299152 RepID=A0A1C5HFQ2_9ACTN|nr:hypothetical protein [Micromonospora siamensis]SCG44889.1 hypothetical protein GA0074704_1655 [Micromonospora siamensis]
MADELFRPTISPTARPDGRQPWRPSSLVYPALLGGAAPVTALALVNARRLGLPGRARAAVLGAGLAALAARVLVTALVLDDDGSRGPGRLIGALAGGLAWLAVSATQKGAFRGYEMRGGEAGSLWGPAVLAVLVLGFAEALLVLTVAGA